MKQTLLKFPSSMYLIAFRRYSKAKNWEIDLTNLTAFCDCSPSELRIACHDFRAQVLELDVQAGNFSADSKADKRSSHHKIAS